MLDPPSSDGSSCVERGVKSFENVLAVVCKALDGVKLEIPEPVLTRARMRSDAMRLLSSVKYDSGSVIKNMVKAESLLHRAIDHELRDESRPLQASSSSSGCKSLRLRELRMLRGQALGTSAIASPADCEKFVDHAAMEFRALIGEEPSFLPAYIELARVFTFSRRWQEALEIYQKALHLLTGAEDQSQGHSTSRYQTQIRRGIAKVEQKLLQSKDNEFVNGSSQDSGDGSGWWRVLAIIGLTWNTCIYQLENAAPAEGHPCPHQAWHVQVWLDSTMREYTPVSSAEDWERGRIDLLVKTYIDGTVSKHFGTLCTFQHALEASLSSYTSLDDQPCWVRLSVPMTTLTLPDLSVACPTFANSPVLRLGIVAGGTGIAPALQLLTEVIDSEGAFGSECQAVLLYSSRTSLDVLMLDELRAVAASSEGRIIIRHTLTDPGADRDEDDLWETVPQQHFQGRHPHFASFFNPFEPRDGPLQTGSDEEAGLRGHVDEAMLHAVLPAPSVSTRVVLSGPQGLLDSSRASLLKLGYSREAIVELRATPVPGSCREDAPSRNESSGRKEVVSREAPTNGGLSFADRVRAAGANRSM